jgi:hypothetical protein
MMRRFWLPLWLTVFFCCGPVDAGEAQLRSSGPGQVVVPLAMQGRALMPIIIAEDAADSTRAVAAELAGYLRRMTGAVFEVGSGDGTAGIILGTLAQFPDDQLRGPLEIRGTSDGREAYAIRAEPGRVRLIGASDLGASHAAFRFLEILGCRWFFPAPEWEVVPRAAELSFNFNETDRPVILARRIWYGYGFFRDGGESGEPGSLADYRAWSRHNRMAGSFAVTAGHIWQTIIARNQAVFEENPEYLALVKGQRQGPQFCVSNPAVRRIAIEFALDSLRRRPAADMVSMETSDGSDHCECGPCEKMGSITDRAFGLANEVARAVAAEFPGKMVGMLAYNDHSEPPSFNLEPNVYVQLTAGFTRGRYTFDELVDLWPTRTANIGFYEYFSVWLWDFDRLPGGRGANVPYIREHIRRYAARNATSMDAESGNNWGPHGRGYYIANRLMWNPDADVEALLADFYGKAFGPAADPMRRYYERLDPGGSPLLSRHLLGLAFRDVEEAARLAADRPDVQARLMHLKQYLRYVHLSWLIEREKDKAAKKALTLDAITHLYRTRRSYMNHWEAIRQAWLPRAAKEFDEPGWVADGRGGKPWQVDRSYTAEETERAFREGLEYFQPRQVAEKSFSDDLVPGGFRGDAPPPASSQAYQNGLPYALYSVEGEPLEVEVITGTIAWYRDRADARYALVAPDGSKLREGRLKLDGQKHPLRFEVPRAGLYFLEFQDSGAGWRINIAAGRPATIPLRRDKGFSHQGHMQRMYFHVPAGTRQVDYYWRGGPHRVLGPDGRPVREVSTTGEFVSIPVPEGADGRVWSFTQLALGHLWFFNIPNVLAASPEALLVPREVLRN